jgi:predicted transposase YbfD/YdcC
LEGKALRGSGTTQLVGAINAASGRTLGVEPVADKSNEIPAGQRLLDRLDLDGTIGLMDALHTQVETARVIVQEDGRKSRRSGFSLASPRLRPRPPAFWNWRANTGASIMAPLTRWMSVPGRTVVESMSPSPPPSSASSVARSKPSPGLGSAVQQVPGMAPAQLSSPK